VTDEIKDGMRMKHGSAIYRHRGHDIRYNENNEVWSCHALNVEHVQLSRVKEMINKIDKQARELGEDGVRVLIVHDYGSVEMKEAYAYAIDANREDVWVTTTKEHYARHGGKSIVDTRKKAKIDTLVLDTPETRAAIQAYLDAEKEVQRVARERREYLKTLPRLTMPELKPVEALSEDDSQKLAARPVRKRTR
jgi:hypothetical protein